MTVGILRLSARLSAIVLCGLAVAWTSGAYAQPKELSVWTMGGDQPGWQKWLDAIKANYEKNNPGQSVKITYYDKNALLTALRTSLRAGQGPDVIYTEPDQICRKGRHPIHLAVGEAVLNDDILANAVAEAPQALFERLDEMELLLPRRDREVTHPVDPSGRLLRPRGQRPCRRSATKKRDEFAPSH